MHLELSVALNFIISYLYNKLPRRRVDMFCEELEKGLLKKFESHWYPEEPFKGSGFRSIKLSNEKVDPVLDMAAQLSGLCISEILEYLPKGLTLWIDPNEVSYRIGENGTVKILYYNHMNSAEDLVLEKSSEHDLLSSGHGFNPRAESFLLTDKQLPSSLSGLNISPASFAGSNGSSSPSSGTSNSTSPVGSFRSRPLASTCFTAAAFAQTKFGSTKMKTQAQRPTRLSPTELNGSFTSVGSKHSPISPLGHASLWASLNPCLSSPTSNVNLIQLSPVQTFPQFIGLRDSRLDLLKEQQQCLLLLQQQQQKMRLHGTMTQNSTLPSGHAAITCSSPVDEGLAKSLSGLGVLYDHHPLPHHHQQQLFLHSPPTSASNKNLSPDVTSIATASDSMLLSQTQQKTASDVLPKPRVDVVAMSNQNCLQDKGSISQITTPDEVDWSALINPYANLSHLLVAN